MNYKTKLGLEILQAALVLAILGDKLLRVTPWGVNVLLWVGALVGVIFFLAWRWRRGALGKEGAWLYAPVLLGAAAFTWRDSDTLKALDILAILTGLGLAAWYARGNKIARAGVSNYALGLLTTGFGAWFEGFTLLFSDIAWRDIPRTGWTKHALAILRGLVIGVPLLLIFGALLTAADAVFAGLVKNTLKFETSDLINHAFFIGLLGWLCLGFLRGALLGQPFFEVKDPLMPAPPQMPTLITAQPTPPPTVNKASALRPSLGVVEVGMVIGLLNLLFASFVLVQVRYFFGGNELVQTTTDLTYSEYARRGFFELVTVATLLLPLLLAAHWLLRVEKSWHEILFRILAGVQIVLLFVIMASAWRRMRLYQSWYGQTELRLYTTMFMLWLALVFVWFGLTVLRGQRQQFAAGALALAFTVLGGLHLLNPDAVIARQNLVHAQHGFYFDADYATSLSADAVPVLVNGWGTLNRDAQCLAVRKLRERWGHGTEESWLSANLSRSQARQIINMQTAKWDALGCPPPPDRDSSHE